MIYILGAAVLVLLVWLGRRAAGRLRARDWRIATGVLATMAAIGGSLMILRGHLLEGGAFVALGVGLAFSARLNGLPGLKRPQALPSDQEARSILGVGKDATVAEIQAAYSRLIRLAHPDRGGTDGLAAQLNAARDRLLGKIRS